MPRFENNLRVGQYYYSRRGTGYSIYRVDAKHPDGTVSSGSNVGFCSNSEAARSLVFQLNGWDKSK